jgi:tetratricopeptide (TPR) repeat protein
VNGDTCRRARQLAETGCHAEAEAALREALADTPDDAELLTQLGYVLRQRREYVAALAASDAAVAARPGHGAAHAERAESLIALIRQGEAIDAAGMAVTLEPHVPGGHLVLARALVSGRRFEEARAAARQGLLLAPQAVEGLLTVAEVERAAGHRTAAESTARAALAIDPGNAHGRWLIAALDAERLRVGPSLRALSGLARASPARPDVISLTWPVRGLLSALRRWFAAAIVLVAFCAAAAVWWPWAAPIGRVLAGLFAAAAAGLAARALIRAGRLPWRCLRLVPGLRRRATRAGMVTVAVLVALLIGYAATGHGWLPAAALAAVPVLWAFGVAESGLRQALRGARDDLRGWLVELGQWWRDSVRELRETWQEDRPPPDQARPTGHSDGARQR